MTKLLFLSLEKRFSKIYSSFSCVTFRVLEKNVLFGFPPPFLPSSKIHPLLEKARECFGKGPSSLTLVGGHLNAKGALLLLSRPVTHRESKSSKRREGKKKKKKKKHLCCFFFADEMPKRKTKQHKHKGNHGHKYSHKTAVRATFLSPHADVLYDEYHEPEKPGTVNRKEYDEDKPGGGKFYCKVTGRHFESALALKNHTKTKRYKKLKKQLLMGPKPHNQRDAEAAAGMAPPTNS